MRAAVVAWTAAHVLTAAVALVVGRDLWRPVARPAPSTPRWTILQLALAMGAVQVVNLVGYRVELFVLEWYGRAWPRSGSTRSRCRRPRRCG